MHESFNCVLPENCLNMHNGFKDLSMLRLVELKVERQDEALLAEVFCCLCFSLNKITVLYCPEEITHKRILEITRVGKYRLLCDPGRFVVKESYP